MPTGSAGRPDEPGRFAVLYPAVAEAARRADADAVGLIGIGRAAALDVGIDRVHITYEGGPVLGDPSSPVQVSCRVVGGRPVPARPVPPVVARVGVDTGPLDLADLAEAVSRVPAGALPVVLTAWTLSRLPPPRRPRFVDRLREAAADRAIAWVSAEGVGVAPEIPTLGDRPASGHSILGLAVFDGSAVRAEALGRCWSRGRVMSWLAGP